LKLIEKALKEIDGSKQFIGEEAKLEPHEEDWSAQQVLEDTDQQEHAWETESWVMLNSGRCIRNCYGIIGKGLMWRYI
jgi:hypothetical protein